MQPIKATTITATGVPQMESKGGKYLTFFLAGEEYGLQILKVREIIGRMPVTPVPRTPVFISGIINLRGKVIPVADLRRKFDMEALVPTEESCIIVVQAAGVDMGILVDKVSEVLDIVGQEIEDTPHFGTDISTDFLLGIGKAQGHVRLLLDIDKVFCGRETCEIPAVAQSPAFVS